MQGLSYRREQPNPNTNTTKDPKGISVICESSRSTKSSQCFKCQGYSQFVVQCPFRNLLIKEIDDDDIETVVHEANDSVTDSDDDVSVASIQLGVIRCPHTTVDKEDWRKSSVFYIYIAHEGSTTN